MSKRRKANSGRPIPRQARREYTVRAMPEMLMIVPRGKELPVDPKAFAHGAAQAHVHDHHDGEPGGYDFTGRVCPCGGLRLSVCSTCGVIAAGVMTDPDCPHLTDLAG